MQITKTLAIGQAMLFVSLTQADDDSVKLLKQSKNLYQAALKQIETFQA